MAVLLLRSRPRRWHRIVLSLTRLRSVIPLWVARSPLLLVVHSLLLLVVHSPLLLVAHSLLLLVAHSLLLLVAHSLLLLVVRSQTQKLSSFVRK